MFVTFTTPLPRTILYMDIMYCITYMICFFIGGIGNFFALHFFSTRNKDLAKAIYIFICAIDFVISLQAPILAAPFISSDVIRVIKRAQVFSQFWGILWMVTSNCSVFLVAVLSLTRTWSVLFPFKKLVSKSIVLLVILLYIVLLTVQATIPFWADMQPNRDKYQYIMEFNFPVWNSEYLIRGRKIYQQVYIIEQYFPLIPIVISGMITIASLKRSSTNSAINKANRQVTITILLFTFTYVILNIPRTVVYFLIAFIDKEIMRFDVPYYHFFHVYEIASVLLNAAINPVLYFFRMKEFRRSIKRMIQRQRDKISGLTTQVVILTSRSTSPPSASPPQPAPMLEMQERNIENMPHRINGHP